MAWYDRLLGRQTQIYSDEEKNNPAQYLIGREEGLTVESREVVTRYRDAYEKLEVVNRAVNIVVDDVAEIPMDVGPKVTGLSPVVKNIRKVTVNNLLNVQPNPFQDINTFKRNRAQWVPHCVPHQTRQPEPSKLVLSMSCPTKFVSSMSWPYKLVLSMSCPPGGSS